MATLLDLDPALLGLADDDVWTGDADWSITGPTPVVGAHAGPTPVLLLRNVGGAPSILSASTAGPSEWTVHLVASFTPGDNAAPGLSAGGVYALTRPDGAWETPLTTTAPLAGLHVLTMAADGVGDILLYVDGTLAGSASGHQDLATMIQLATFAGDGQSMRVARFIALDEVPATLADDMADLVAAYVPEPTGLVATGTYMITGTAVLATSDPWAPVDIPSPPPGGSVTPPAPPTPQDPPAGVPDPVVRRTSEIMPAPTLDSRGNPIDWQPTAVISEEYARFQVVVEGVDITYLWGVPLPIPSWDRAEPFGSGSASIQVPQITAFHVLPSWCRAGANVDIRLVPLVGDPIPRFSGEVMTFGHSADAGTFTLECLGVVFVDDLQLRQPAFLTAPRDIGAVVAEALNSTVSKRHADVAPVVTGCMTGVLGGWEPKVTGYITQLLATAVTGGRQWTVACADRSPALVLKDTETVSWTVSNGQRGIDVDLLQDWSKAPNVLYASGIAPDGGRWQNAMYPNWRPDDTPPYPFSNPSTTIRVGTTDSATDTGNGVSVWQTRVGMPATGYFGQADRARAREVQRAGGITVDGIVGPQTWATTFDTGANTGTLECFYMPVAYSPTVMPRLYGPDGADLGPNPDYDPDVVRVEDKIDYGQGVDKTTGTRASQEILAREIDPGWIGRVTFEMDPEEGSRFEVSEGSNGIIKHFRGESLQVHVARVDYGPDTVTATVDTKARDFPALDAIMERERNATDPAKSMVKRLTSGSIGTDRATFDSESPAGHLPRHAVFSNLWDVRRIPFGAYGRIVRTELTTDGPARAFSMGVFARPITAATLLAIMGNPLTAETNPWSEHGEALDAAGLLMSWGWAKQPLGYWPEDFNTPDGESSAPLTGRYVDDASWEYASQHVPWLWVATIASGSTYVSGRFWPGVD